MEATGRVHPAVNAAVNERYPQFSPDGEWFVYSSNERVKKRSTSSGFEARQNGIRYRRTGDFAGLGTERT